MSVVLVYLFAFGIPLLLLYRFHACAWPWHVLAVLAGLAMGFVPMPETLRSRAADMVFGGILVFLLTWGVGGLVAFHPHREKHA